MIHLIGLQNAYWMAILAITGAGFIAHHTFDMAPAERRPSNLTQLKPRILDVARSHHTVLLTLEIGVLLMSAVRSSRQGIIPLWADPLGMTPRTTSLIYGLVAAFNMSVVTLLAH